MWLVGKDTTGKTGRVAISDELKAALVRWYTGRGSEADHRASVSLVSTARENHKWIACDCLGAERPPPLMSAAYLSFQETYYLRRLTSRPGHDARLPVSSAPGAAAHPRDRMKDSLYAIGLPKGLFSAHQKAPEKLAQRPEDIEPDDRSRGVAIPRLGKLLWLLLERAGSQTSCANCRLPAGAQARSAQKCATSSAPLEGLDIAPGIRLSDHLYTNAIDYEKRRVHARLRAAAETWPPAFAPQAFLLLEASEVTSSEVVTGLGTVVIRNRIQHTGIIRAEVEPPFLVLAVVGEHSRREGYLALRAYAQPVFSGNQFVPAERDHDRDVLRALQQAQYELRRLGVRMAVKKVLFDITLAAGSARPDFLVALLDEHSGLECKFALQILQSDDADYLELRSIERERLSQAGLVVSLPVSSVTPEAIISEARSLLE
jgi:hypothetical protein